MLAVLLLGIIVGASVGATQSKKHKNNIAVDPRSSSSVSGGASAATPAATGAGGGQSQGVGGAPITSAVPGESGGGTGGENGATSAASSTRTRSGAAVQTAGPAVLFPVPTATGGTGNDGAGVGLSGIGNVFGTDQVST